MVKLVGFSMLLLGLAFPWAVTIRAAAPESKGPLHPSLIRIPAGTFSMGSPESEIGRVAEHEQLHEVRLTHDFEICSTEVTVLQWSKATGVTPDCTECEPFPVEDVSWEQAILYLNEISEFEGLQPCYQELDDDWIWDRSCDGYRLPTEAEWEYAARAASRTTYSHGDDVESLSHHAWYGRSSPHEAGALQPNRWEIHDMHGNVEEWVWDRFSAHRSEPSINPTGPDVSAKRMTRGGSYADDESLVRAASRRPRDPAQAEAHQGLRCARGPHPG
jgi:formylglycine-generating enzyme